MKASLLSKIQGALKRRGYDEYEFSRLLVERGAQLPLHLWDNITPPSKDIWLASELLAPMSEASELFELTEYRTDLAWAYFKKVLPEYQDRIQMNEQAAWQHITTLRDFKRQSTDELKQDIRTLLEGLVPPSPGSAGRITCSYPDCNGFGCGLRCGITGEFRGSESW